MSASPLHLAVSLPVTGVATAALAVAATPAPAAATADTTPAADPDTGSVAHPPAVDATTAPAASATAAEAFAARAAAADGKSATTMTTASTTHAAPAATQVQSPTTAGSLGGALFALVLVIGLILLLSKLAKRMPGLGGGGSANPALRIVGSLALGPRDRLVVVEVGQTQLLLGVGAGGTRTLHTLDQPLPAVADKPTPAFAQLLSQHFGKKS